MKQTADTRSGKFVKRSERKRKSRLIRRTIAAAVAVLAIVLAVLAWKSMPYLSGFIWFAAVVVLLVEAVLLARRHGLPRSLYIILGVLCVALIALGPLGQRFVLFEGQFQPKEVLITELRVMDSYPDNLLRMTRLQSLDMRGSTVKDFSPLHALRSLRKLDVRENYAFTQAQADAMQAAVPECDVRWSLPVAGTYFDSAQEDLDLTNLSLSASEVRGLFDRYPEKRISYQVTLFGKQYAPSLETLDLTGEPVDTDEIADALSMLPAVKEVDLRGTPAPVESIAALEEMYPDIHFMFSCEVPSGTMTTEDATVTISGGDYDDLQAFMAYIDYMPNLNYMDARAMKLSNEQFVALQSDPHTAKVVYAITVFGVKVSSLDTELNLDNVKVSGPEAVEKCLEVLPNIKKVSMCNSGLSDAQMGQLFDAHPDIKFVWILKIGGRYKVRTDATMFTTDLWDGNDFNYTSSTFASLKYCTDLLMLDLGHCRIRSLEGLKSLTKLRVLILADNKIKDISALEGLEDLEYVELFLNDIKDFSPLANKQKLIDVNIFYNPTSDITPFLSCPALERFWAGGCKYSNEDLMKLKEAVPNVKINIKGRSSTGEGWRKHKRYDVLDQMYKVNEYIPFS